MPTREFLFLSKTFCMLINFFRALWTRNHTGIAESGLKTLRMHSGHGALAAAAGECRAPLAPCRDVPRWSTQPRGGGLMAPAKLLVTAANPAPEEVW